MPARGTEFAFGRSPGALINFSQTVSSYGACIKSIGRSIEKKSLNLRLEGRWVGINTKIQRPFASIELARCVKHQTHARHAYCRGFESRLELFS